ncbi:VPS9 domain-containing protein 1-like isoform X2 [Physella acuta]|uniref:VPS9 domain-containing protein 1-like isoform X2 n=1 Tax=Physella acuta TaxID=109671 RepID=UPI0027DD98CF|nr:VPS9 domain-containing protein 1-like isoform X2 [Physella acuta]
MTESNLPSLMKEIGEALRLDNDGIVKEAYKKYVSCIYKISTNLILAMKKAGGDVVVDKKTCKQVKLVQQCVDRVAALVEKLESTTTSMSTVTVGVTSSHLVSPVRPSVLATTPPPSPLTSPAQLPVKFNSLVPLLPDENNPHIYTVNKTPTLTPMEIAQKQNQSLMTAYKARMKRLNRSDFNAFSYSLTIQRKMAENIAIAQAQEEEKWLQNWRSKLDSNPEDPILISQLVAEILRCQDHPLTELLRKYQFKIYERLYPLVANKHQDLELIKVPFPKKSWPSLDSVSEIIFQRESSPPPVQKSKDTPEDSVKSTGCLQAEDGKQVDDRSSPENSKDETVTNDPESWVDPLCVRSETLNSIHSITEDQHSDNAGIKSNLENVNSDDISSESDKSSNGADVLAQSSAREGKSDSPLQLDDCKEPSGDSARGTSSQPADTGSTPTDTNTVVDRQDSPPVHITISSDDSSQASKRSTEHVENSNNAKNPFFASTPNASKTSDVSTDRLSPGDGQELTTQLSWERRQAQLLMRQVTRDYSRYKMDCSEYDEDTLDYLFEDDVADGEDEYDYQSLAYNFRPSYRTAEPSVPDHVAEVKKSEKVDNSSLDRSVSLQPPSSNTPQDETDTCHSLPSNMKPDKKFDELTADAYSRHLKAISDDIHRYLEKLLVMMTTAYESLDTPVGRDQCAVSLEEPFFKPIWKTLLRLFRVVNYKQEQVLACIMTSYANVSPEEMKVSKKLCLQDSGDQQPYQRAITELCHVQEYYTMLSKLECVVKVCRLICECVDDYYRKKDGDEEHPKVKAPSVGADDLLPILSYVIIRSSLPQLGAECDAMTEFIHEGYMMGEEGYCLTTLRTALNFVTSLFPSCL